VRYWTCETLRELVIYAMVIFSPWAFGTTQGWSIWAMNVTAYVLALLSVLSWTIRKLARYEALEWGTPELPARQGMTLWRRPKVANVALGTITVALLTYCLTSALNARATFRPGELRFEYHVCVAWLPHSYDSTSTWFAFWTYLGLVCVFWSTCDWLSAKSGAEIGSQGFPRRLRRLLWLLSLNGGLLATECIIQRLADSPKLLFLVKPHIHQTAITQFGPYAYRANAAQYLNLLWPLCLGLWFTFNSSQRPKHRHAHLLLVCSALMSAGAIISASRGGALISGSMLLTCGLLVLTRGHFRLGIPTQLDFPSIAVEGKPFSHVAQMSRATILTTCLLAGPILALAFGWHEIKSRMPENGDSMKARLHIYDVVSHMIRDFGVFGAGPGTFQTVSELYHPAEAEFWPAQAHNDWLETRLTFGLPGCTLFLLALGLVILRWFIPGGLPARAIFVWLSWLALLGCLIHSAFDFPFQIHSIAFLFVVECAILFTLSRRPWLA